MHLHLQTILQDLQISLRIQRKTYTDGQQAHKKMLNIRRDYSEVFSKGTRSFVAGSDKEGYEVITMTENGYGKRSSIEDYRLQNRSGKGIKAGQFNEKTGKLVSLKLISDNEDVMIITSAGTIIRVAASDISKIGRDTQGVRVMKIQDSVVSKIAVVPKSDEEEGEIGEEIAVEPTEGQE